MGIPLPGVVGLGVAGGDILAVFLPDQLALPDQFIVGVDIVDIPAAGRGHHDVLHGSLHQEGPAGLVGGDGLAIVQLPQIHGTAPLLSASSWASWGRISASASETACSSAAQGSQNYAASEELLSRALEAFCKIRSLPQIKKKPSASEIIGWIQALRHGGVDVGRIVKEVPYLGVRLKKNEDVGTLRRQWR